MSEAPRHIPYDIEVEQALLGSILLNNSVYWRIAENLAPKDFYDPLHERLYRMIDRLAARDDRITPLTLNAAMKSDPGLVEIGGHGYLVGLAQAAPAGANIREYADILRKLAVRRRVIAIGEDLVSDAYQPPEETTPDELADRASEALYEATKSAKPGEGAISVRVLAQRAADRADQARNMPASVCLTSGLWTVDEHLGGVYRRDLTFIGGAPNSGKTSLIEHIAFANSEIHDPENPPEEVLFFSMEMTAEEIATRKLAQRARVPSDKMRRGMISEEEAERLFLGAHQFPDLPYKIDGSRRLSVAQMRARTQAAKRRSNRGVKLVAIDNLRLIRPANTRADEREQLHQITSDLKDMGAELDVAVVCIAHLSREYAKRTSNRPQLSDLYGSSSIEQNADSVWFVHREIYFLERNVPSGKNGSEEHTLWLARCEQERGRAEVFAAKQRMGPIGGAKVMFEEKFTQYSDEKPKPTQEEMTLWKGLLPQ